MKRLCIPLKKGMKVMVKERVIGFECIEIIGQPSTACFNTENVSGTIVGLTNGPTND